MTMFNITDGNNNISRDKPVKNIDLVIGLHVSPIHTRRLHGAHCARGTSLCPGHILLFGHVNILVSLIQVASHKG